MWRVVKLLQKTLVRRGWVNKCSVITDGGKKVPKQLICDNWTVPSIYIYISNECRHVVCMKQIVKQNMVSK